MCSLDPDKRYAGEHFGLGKGKVHIKTSCWFVSATRRSFIVIIILSSKFLVFVIISWCGVSLRSGHTERLLKQ